MALRTWLSRLAEFAVQVRGRSMAPTLEDGESITARKASAAPLGRGDMVIFESPEARGRLEVKRIVGLPGEEVTWAGGRININGQPLEEPYAHAPEAPPGDTDFSWCRLGEHEYFVAGDNRLHSRDSRQYTLGSTGLSARPRSSARPRNIRPPPAGRIPPAPLPLGVWALNN
jgi:signal peptidase I